MLVLGIAAWVGTTPRSRPAAAMARGSFDLTQLLLGDRTREASTSQVALVYVDLKTYEREGRDPKQPLDRELYARLVRRMTAAGARVVIFDIVFDRPDARVETDRDLADAFREHGGVILGAEWQRSEVDGVDGRRGVLRAITMPTPALLEAAGNHGLVFARVDPDLVVRRHFAGFLDRDLPSLEWVAARRLRLPVVEQDPKAERSRWLSYYGPPLTLPGVSLSDALDASVVPDAFFRDRVVFVGTRPAAGTFDERRDEWRSPLTSWGQVNVFMPAVEVHATQMLNLVRGDWLTRPAPGWEFLGLFGVAVALAWFFLRLRPWPLVAAVGGSEVLVIVFATYAAQVHRVWFPWVTLSALLIPLAAFLSYLTHTMDWLRQRRRYLAQIRDQAALIDKAQDAIVVTDLDGTVTYANPRARALYGWAEALPEAARLQGQWSGQGQPALDAAMRTARERGEWSGEMVHGGANGVAMTVESRATLIRDDTGRSKALMWINTDVTEKRRLQDQFLRAQRMESVGALASGMAHDLNNALSPVLMGIQLMKRRTQDDETRRMLDVMESQTHRGAGMVRQVLRFSRGKESGRTTLALGVILAELEAMLRETFPKALDIQVLVPGDLWPVSGDATQIHQALVNLCVNARDAMPGGGRLTIAADNADLSADEAAAMEGARPGRHVMLMVEDSGMGMPPEVQERIFEPFYTTKPAGKGTGLGLAGVVTIVRAHGGVLKVRSRVGEGTAFEIYLPASTEAETSESVSVEIEAGPRGRGEWVLVVADERSIRDLVVGALRDGGYQTAVASTNVEAEALARRLGGQLRLAIVDWQWPAELGATIVGELRRAQDTLPILQVGGATAGAGDTVIARVERPYTTEVLLRRVREMLDAK